MPISVQGTQITFNDSTNQASAYVGDRGSFITSTSTFTIPAGITAIKATAVGGGAGGAGSTMSQVVPGGGPGGTGIQFFTGLTPGATLAVTIGGGGNGGDSGNIPGQTGGTTTLASGNQSITTLSCAGGAGVSRADVNGTNVTGAPGAVNNAAFTTNFWPPFFGTNFSGTGGVTYFGRGGAPIEVNVSSNGNAGVGRGAGGGGASAAGANRSGGAGVGGAILIEY
jgi:hypothetical protein